eukprot:473812-Pyramimonas_sp.AAC.1
MRPKGLWEARGLLLLAALAGHLGGAVVVLGHVQPRVVQGGVRIGHLVATTTAPSQASLVNNITSVCFYRFTGLPVPVTARALETSKPQNLETHRGSPSGRGFG